MNLGNLRSFGLYPSLDSLIFSLNTLTKFGCPRMSLIIVTRSSEHCISQFITIFRVNGINI